QCLEKFHFGKRLHAPVKFLLLLELLAPFALLGDEDALRGDRKRDPHPLEGEINSGAHERVRRVINGEVGQPVAHRVMAIALPEVEEDAVWLRLSGDSAKG